LDARKIGDLIRCNLLPACYVAPPEIRDLRRVLRYRNLVAPQSGDAGGGAQTGGLLIGRGQIRETVRHQVCSGGRTGGPTSGVIAPLAAFTVGLPGPAGPNGDCTTDEFLRMCPLYLFRGRLVNFNSILVDGHWLFPQMDVW
jgi:hypothetical protein